MGTGIALPATLPATHTPGTPLPYPAVYRAPHRPGTEQKEAVGLRSVAQLTLRSFISDLRVITEVYNLVEIGNR